MKILYVHHRPNQYTKRIDVIKIILSFLPQTWVTKLDGELAEDGAYYVERFFICVTLGIKVIY